jgi:hypothetical protein
MVRPERRVVLAAKAMGAFYAAVVKPEGDEETPGSLTGVDRQTTQRKQLEQMIAELTPVLRGWGNYFRTGNADREFNKMDSFVVKSLRRWQYRRGGQRPASAIHRRSAIRDGFAQIDGHSEVSDASHTQKIIVKPCAGKRHARFERGY